MAHLAYGTSAQQPTGVAMKEPAPGPSRTTAPDSGGLAASPTLRSVNRHRGPEDILPAASIPVPSPSITRNAPPPMRPSRQPSDGAWGPSTSEGPPETARS